MKRNSLLVLLIISIFAFGCGKKTAPVAKSEFKIPVPAESVVKNTRAGVGFFNDNKEFGLQIFKSVADSSGKCTGEYALAGTAAEGGEFVDKSVKEGGKVFYKLRYIDLNYNVAGEFAELQRIYAQPESIIDVKQSYKNGMFNIKAVSKPSKGTFELVHQGKVIQRSARGLFDVSVISLADGRVSIRALDKFGNLSDTKEVVLFAGSPSVFPPFGLKVVKADAGDIISWEEPEGVSEYRVYVGEKTSKMVDETNSPYYMIADPACSVGCCVISVTSVKGELESAPERISYCP